MRSSLLFVRALRCWSLLAVLLTARPMVSARAQGIASERGRVRPLRTADTLASGVTQQVTLSAMTRSYTIAGARVTEASAPFEWSYAAPHLAMGVTGAPLRFSAAPTIVRAWTPTRVHLDVVPHAGDTLSVYGQMGSVPVNLDSLQGESIGTVNTAIVDLSSLELGVPGQAGARLVLTRPMATMTIGVSAAIEQDARPPATGFAWYQGTTGRAAVTATIPMGAQELSLSGDLSVSKTDSLGGRNQFPGGGMRGVSASLTGFLDGQERVHYELDAYYDAPFGTSRNDQLTRLIPLGTYAGWSASAETTTGRVTWTPSLSWAQESSDASVQVRQGLQRVRTTLHARASSWSAGMRATVALGHGVTLLPDVGCASGGIHSTLDPVAGRVVIRPGRPTPVTLGSTTRSPLSGVWAGLGVGIHF